MSTTSYKRRDQKKGQLILVNALEKNVHWYNDYNQCEVKGIQTAVENVEKAVDDIEIQLLNKHVFKLDKCTICPTFQTLSGSYFP